MNVAGALGDLAAAGIVAADERWVRYALERRRSIGHQMPGQFRRRLPYGTRHARVSLSAVRAALAVGVPTLRIVVETSEPETVDEATAEELLGDAALPAVLVCADAMLATLIRAHDLSMETGAPVLALPAAGPLPAWVRRGAERAGSSGRVVFLHDCDARSLITIDGLAERLGVTRVDPIGIRPAQARRLRLPATRGPRPAPEVVARAADVVGMTDTEARWLATGRRAEAAAVSPDRLLRSLRRILLGSRTPPALRRFPTRTAGFM